MERFVLNLMPALSFVFVLAILFALQAESVSAATRSSSRDRVSSSMQRAIRALDDDKAERIPVPVLFGLPLARVTSDFGDPRGGGTRTHEGQDFLAPRGTPVASPTEAVVTGVGDGESSGLTVRARGPGGENYIYMHLDSVAEGVKAGTTLEAGEILGFVGDTGNAKGGPAHLHFEIRGKKALDPFPRLERTFSAEEVAASIDEYLDRLDDEDDEEEFAEDMVALNRSVFVQARLAGVDLPEAIDDALGVAVAPAAGTAERDLSAGSQGDDVVRLQVALVALDSGPAAKALASAGATGYFGPVTQAALAEFQRSAGIVPASGYFGPLTRARMLATAP